ncbi:hypothetical protein [Segniliparus rugosus]|uniref:Uncharacterized protein n=1 Tax=Segniliparus rugosus (strain ATCC BAA-974 / DSM 45345 / CCUG 50838 / CIP 108380 / JCM 13579 / CDC 945) TaxID=679197 RepID=E5XU40_SEGRC|nr:hypothetical protein [Segniliparus rugosus]EFV12103.1 hypothetical protein HMPREF9336_03012 [Segniliparus rugosus ATCC BAA-974]
MPLADAADAAAFALCLLILPDGGSAAAIVAFVRDDNVLLEAVMGLTFLSFPATIYCNALVASKLYAADTSPGHRLSWTAVGSDIVTVAFLAVLFGILAANVLLVDKADAGVVHALRVVCLVSAYLIGGLSAPFLLAFATISKRANLFPSWLNAQLSP